MKKKNNLKLSQKSLVNYFSIFLNEHGTSVHTLYIFLIKKLFEYNIYEYNI